MEYFFHFLILCFTFTPLKNEMFLVQTWMYGVQMNVTYIEYFFHSLIQYLRATQKVEPQSN